MHRHRGLPLAAAFALLAVPALAGCASSPADGAADPMPAVQYDDGTVAVLEPSLPTAAPADGERTLDAAPAWRLGEWWTYRFDNLLTGQSFDLRRVVAGSEAGTYLVGFPVEEFSNEALVLHVPGYGDVQQADLSFETHDAPFRMLDFPLADGKTWDLAYQGVSTGTAFVTVQSDGTALIEAPTSGYNITGVYDPALGELRELTIAGYAHYEVTGHGYGFEGVVRVPHDHDLVFRHGRTGPLFDYRAPLVPPTAALPSESVEVQGGYDRLGFAIAMGGTAAAAVTTGQFGETVTAPDGTTFTASMGPAEGGLKIQYFGHDDPEGTWTMQHQAAGAGFVLVEGIGYHSIDIELPSGCVVASANAMHHGTLCRA